MLGCVVDIRVRLRTANRPFVLGLIQIIRQAVDLDRLALAQLAAASIRILQLVGVLDMLQLS